MQSIIIIVLVIAVFVFYRFSSKKRQGMRMSKQKILDRLQRRDEDQ